MSKNVDTIRLAPKTAPEMGEALRTLRRARGLTQGQLAIAAGISRPTMIALEAGQGRAETLLKLVRMLGGTITLSLTIRPDDDGEELGVDF